MNRSSWPRGMKQGYWCIFAVSVFRDNSSCCRNFWQKAKSQLNKIRDMHFREAKDFWSRKAYVSSGSFGFLYPYGENYMQRETTVKWGPLAQLRNIQGVHCNPLVHFFIVLAAIIQNIQHVSEKNHLFRILWLPGAKNVSILLNITIGSQSTWMYDTRTKCQKWFSLFSDRILIA